MTFAPTQTVLDAVTDFLATAPTLEEIAAYRVPEALDARLQYLMSRNSEGEITGEERAEFEDYLRLGHMMKILKAKARIALRKREGANAGS
jgi:hypothetical protein